MKWNGVVVSKLNQPTQSWLLSLIKPFWELFASCSIFKSHIHRIGQHHHHHQCNFSKEWNKVKFEPVVMILGIKGILLLFVKKNSIIISNSSSTSCGVAERKSVVAFFLLFHQRQQWRGAIAEVSVVPVLSPKVEIVKKRWRED